MYRSFRHDRRDRSTTGRTKSRCGGRRRRHEPGDWSALARNRFPGENVSVGRSASGSPLAVNLLTNMDIIYLARIPLLVVALTYPVAFASAASETATPADQSSSQDSSQSPELKAAEDRTQAYIAAYNKGDAKTLANFYAEDVDYIDKNGAEVKGRDAIQTASREFPGEPRP
jgi:hypothetical protein